MNIRQVQAAHGSRCKSAPARFLSRRHPPKTVNSTGRSGDTQNVYEIASPISQHSQRTLNTLPCQKENSLCQTKKSSRKVGIQFEFGKLEVSHAKKTCYISLYWSFNMDPYWFIILIFSWLRCILKGHWQYKSWFFLAGTATDVAAKKNVRLPGFCTIGKSCFNKFS